VTAGEERGEKFPDHLAMADDDLADFFFGAREDALEFSHTLIGRLFRSRSHPFSFYSS